MFDNLPFYTTDAETISAFLNSGLLDFKGENITYNKETGEEIRKTRSKYKNLTIYVAYNEKGTPKELTSKGSFHYLMNNGTHNANQYTFEEMRSILLEFRNSFNIDLQKLNLFPSEFAVNIEIPFDVEKVVQHTYLEKRKAFNNNSVGNPSKISGKVSNDYRLKVYSKYHEYPEYCNPHTLRLEYQAKKMRGLKSRCNVDTLKDLTDLKNWVKIKEFHLSYFKHLVIYDYTMKFPKNSKFKKRANEMNHPHHWENLIKDCRKGEEYTNKYNEEVETLNSFSKKYGCNMLQVILELTEKQWNINLKTCLNHSYFEIKKPKYAPLTKRTYAPFIVCKPCLHYKKNLGKKCLVTKLPIHMQRADSFLLSNTGLKYLQQTNPAKFNFLKDQLLTGKPNQYERNIYSRISKQIRNRYFNNLARYQEQTLF